MRNYFGLFGSGGRGTLRICDGELRTPAVSEEMTIAGIQENIIKPIAKSFPLNELAGQRIAVDANALPPAGQDGSTADGEAGAEGFQAGTTTLATN